MMLSRALAIAALFSAILLTAAYWPGLNGPLLLDDFENLAPLSRYRDGSLTAYGVIFGNHSGMLGRPISMASFLLDTELWGSQLFGFKLTNLLLHLVSTALVWLLLSRLLRRDPSLRDARWLPLWLAVLWAALPLHASTVLYVIQRMAMLSALFTLMALLIYVHGRECYESNRPRTGGIWIWLAFPAVVGIATLAKENGVLAIPLAAVVELTWYQRAERQRSIRAVFLLTLGLPLLAALAIFSLYPERLTDGYAGRDFTLAERLMTQPRILWDYVGAALIPNAPKLGLFHDDYAISRGLLSPASTLVAIALWLIVIVAALLLRRSAPAITFGIGFFLAAHAMESSILPLELYFEHRNYLASIGLLVAAAGVGRLAVHRLNGATQAMRWASLALAFVVPATYIAATHGRAKVWSSEDTLYAQEEAHNPNSPRLNAILGARAMERGDLAGALRYVERAEVDGPRREHMTATIRRMLAYCAIGRPIPEPLYLQAEERISDPATQYGMVAWEMLAQRAERKHCQTDNVRLANLGVRWVALSGTSRRSHAAWRIHYNSARLLASSGKMDRAAQLALEAFQDSGYNFGVGVLAFQTCASFSDPSRCKSIAERLTSVADPQDRMAIKTAEAFLKASHAGH